MPKLKHKEPKEVLNVRLEKKVLARLKEQAKLRETTQARLVEEALDSFLQFPEDELAKELKHLRDQMAALKEKEKDLILKARKE